MRESFPSKLKFENKLEYYKKRGYLKKNIKIYKNGMLIDGYLSYLVLKEHGVTECVVDVCEKRRIKPEADMKITLRTAEFPNSEYEDGTLGDVFFFNNNTSY